MKTFSIEADAIPRFLALSRRLNGADPRWVPPFDAVLARELAGQDAFGSYGRMRLFLCGSGGEDAGRVAAIVNPRLRDAAGAPIGQLGYFECVDDVEVARALFDEASAWLGKQGCREAWGPMNGGAHRTHRCLVEGFERAPYLFEPRNPAHHPRLWESQGFRTVHTWNAFDLPASAVRAGLLEVAGAAPVIRWLRRHYAFEPLDPRDPVGSLARLHAILDRLWHGHVGYASLGIEEFSEVFAGPLSIMGSRHVGVVANLSTRMDVGAGFMYPDYAEEVRELGGDASGWGRWLSRGTRPRRAVLHTVATVPEARGTGAVSLCLEQAARVLEEEGYADVVIAVVTEEFRIFEKFASPTRRYALYGRRMS